LTADLQALDDSPGPKDGLAIELLDALPISTACLADAPKGSNARCTTPST